MSTAEEICRRALKMDEDKVTTSSWKKDEENQEEDERKRSIMKKRDKLRKWDPGSGLRSKRHKNLLDKRNVRPMSDHLDLFQHICRYWNGKADRLTHEARKRGPVGTRSRCVKEKNWEQ